MERMINRKKRKTFISLLEKRHHRDLSRTWAGEKVYFRGDDYFRGLIAAVRRARYSVDMESYIFESGVLGDRLIAALTRASQRGVRVRLLVDGVGSPDFAAKYGNKLEVYGVQYRVFRSWRWFFCPRFPPAHKPDAASASRAKA